MLCVAPAFRGLGERCLSDWRSVCLWVNLFVCVCPVCAASRAPEFISHTHTHSPLCGTRERWSQKSGRVFSPVSLKPSSWRGRRTVVNRRAPSRPKSNRWLKAEIKQNFTFNNSLEQESAAAVLNSPGAQCFPGGCPMGGGNSSRIIHGGRCANEGTRRLALSQAPLPGCLVLHLGGGGWGQPRKRDKNFTIMLHSVMIWRDSASPAPPPPRAHPRSSPAACCSAPSTASSSRALPPPPPPTPPPPFPPRPPLPPPLH